MTDQSGQTTHFGFQEVPLEEKARRVGEVFHSVASRYDLMNDLMSLGVHRLWKRFAIAHAGIRPGQRVLDVAGGTGDLSARIARRVGPRGRVVLSDINASMLEVGRDQLIDQGLAGNIDYVQADAEHLPFAEDSFDVVTIAFGLRNVTDKQTALESMQRVLRPGGCLLVLEFSQVVLPLLKRLYEPYSFKLIPWIGERVTGDRDSYQYLVESIRRHPDQQTLLGMLQQAGLEMGSWHNLSGGIVAVHRAYKL